MADERRPRVRLVDVGTDEAKIGRIIDGFANRDVWRNLDRKGPIERRGHFMAKFHSGYYSGHLIEDADSDVEYGFFLLQTNRLRAQGRVEVDIAIPSREHRKLGVAKLAFVALFDHWLLADRCQELWGWIDVGNRASVKMIEALQIPVYNETRREIADDGPVDIIEVHMTRDIWELVRPALAGRWGL